MARGINQGNFIMHKYQQLFQTYKKAIRKAKGFMTLTGQIDHEHMVTVVGLMYEQSPEWANKVTDYMPSTAIH